MSGETEEDRIEAIVADRLRDHRLDSLETTVRAFGPAIAGVAALDAKTDDLKDDVGRIEDYHKGFRVEIRQKFDELKKELHQDRREARTRTLLALSPIALAALAIFARVVLGIDAPH